MFFRIELTDNCIIYKLLIFIIGSYEIYVFLPKFDRIMVICLWFLMMISPGLFIFWFDIFYVGNSLFTQTCCDVTII